MHTQANLRRHPFVCATQGQVISFGFGFSREAKIAHLNLPILTYLEKENVLRREKGYKGKTHQ